MTEQAKGSTFEQLYLQQRKKSSLLLVAVIVLAITTAGSLAWGFSKTGSGSSPSNTPGNFQGQGFGGQGGPGGGGMNLDVKQFFNDDGSVNNDEVKSFLSRMPSGTSSSSSNSSFNFLDRFKERINQSADDGDITQEQADALIKAFETESNSNES